MVCRMLIKTFLSLCRIVLHSFMRFYRKMQQAWYQGHDETISIHECHEGRGQWSSSTVTYVKT